MKNIVAIAERETKAYFTSPMAYILILFFVFISGCAYTLFALRARQADMSFTIEFMSTLILFLSPLMTMRLFTEERKQGTLEILLTAPVTETEAVLGKFFAAVIMYLVMLLLTAHYPLFLLFFGHPDKGPIWTSYLGLILLGSCYISIGVLASSFAKNQIVAAVMTFGVCLLLLILSAFSSSVSGTLGDIFKYFSFEEHFQDFIHGVIDTRHLIFFFSFIGFMLFLSVLNIRNKKWR